MTKNRFSAAAVATAPHVKPSRVSSSIRLSDDLHKRVKIYAAKNDMRIFDVLETAIVEYLADKAE